MMPVKWEDAPLSEKQTMETRRELSRYLENLAKGDRNLILERICEEENRVDWVTAEAEILRDAKERFPNDPKKEEWWTALQMGDLLWDLLEEQEKKYLRNQVAEHGTVVEMPVKWEDAPLSEKQQMETQRELGRYLESLAQGDRNLILEKICAEGNRVDWGTASEEISKDARERFPNDPKKQDWWRALKMASILWDLLEEQEQKYLRNQVAEHGTVVELDR